MCIGGILSGYQYRTHVSRFKLRTLNTVATFYAVNSELYNFFCEKHTLCRFYLDIRICNKKGGTVLALLRKCFESDFALTLLRKRNTYFIEEQKYFG